MEGDISKVLTYQVKKEIAERYFGTRRLIEHDMTYISDLIQLMNNRYESKIGPGLVRIYSLLMDMDIIDRFLALIKWDGHPFLDSYVVESKTIRKRLVEKIRSHGWFQRSRFVNLILDSYRELYREYKAIADMEEEAREELEIIKEELKIFKEKYSLEEIMTFVRHLDFEGQDMAKVMGGNVTALDPNDLTKKMDFGDIKLLEKQLPRMPALPEPDVLESALRELSETAYSRHGEMAAAAISMTENG